MAAAIDPNRYRTAGAGYARDAWHAVQQHGTSAWQQVRAFLVTHPPLIQGLYYVLVGLWPLLALDSFMQATGHKVDFWLAQKVGLLLVVIGSTLCLAAYRRAKSPEILLLGVASSTMLAGASLLFVLTGTISLIYLLDAAVEVGLLGLWLHAWYVENVVYQSADTPAAATPAVPANGQAVVAGGAVAPPPPSVVGPPHTN
jgi:hypothetical protein